MTEEIKALMRDVYDYINDKKNYEKEMWKEAYFYLSTNSLEETSTFKESRVYRFYMSKINSLPIKENDAKEEVKEVVKGEVKEEMKGEVKEEEKIERAEKIYIFLEGGNRNEISIDQDLVKEVELLVDNILSHSCYQEYLKGVF